MASISSRKNGSRFITFFNGQRQRKTITLGTISKRSAESIKVRVEDLASALASHHAPKDDTVRWLSEIDDKLHDKLAKVGLTPARVSTSLSCWLDQYVSEKEDDLKPESIRKLRQTQVKLKAYFDDEIELRKITPQQAIEWRRFLKQLGLSDAAIKTHCGNAKSMLAEAVRRKLIVENPMLGLKSGPTPSKYTRYITPEEIDLVIEACPDSEWRLLFGLARLAGLRIPSESHLLTWADVDFERSRLTVRSPKTEHHAGHEQRIVPITPKLMELISDRYESCPEGEQRLVTISGKGALIRKVRPIWKRAGVKGWERLWQTLRQSCEKEWAMTFPQFAVSKWIGHSITVSGRHYANDVPDELFALAADHHPPASRAQRQAQQNMSARAGNAQKQKKPAEGVDGLSSGVCRDLQDISTSPCPTSRWSRGDSNPRAETVSEQLLRV